MKLNWVGFRFIREDGYGRYGIHFIRALMRLGVQVTPIEARTFFDMPADLLPLTGVDTNVRSIFLMPPFTVKQPPPPHSWIYTMHEDSKLPDGWADKINLF